MAEQQAKEQADRLVGLRVYNVAGRKLGRVEEVSFDDDTGEIDCLTVSDDRLLGFWRHRFKVAWSAVTYSETRHALVFAPGVHGEHEEHMPPPESQGDTAARPQNAA
ncbi:MAG: PRC-barrel domain-containing protein [Pseudomonadota bacterium]|nr:PRC-barrel domain-containing protein [Pseudomonadota bacterium]